MADPIVLRPDDLIADSRFGYSVDLNEEFAVVGAPGLAAVYIYRFDNGEATFVQKLALPNQSFGKDVAIHGGRLIVSANSTAFIFQHNGANWEQEAVIPRAGAFRVALSDDTAVIGTASDRAHVYQRDGSVWFHLQSIDLNPATFVTVDVYGESMVLGSAQSVRLLRRIDGLWQTEQTITLPDPPNYDEHGITVSLDLNRVLVGFGSVAHGRIARSYVYQSGSWTLEQELQAPPPIQTSTFGEDLAVRGNHAIFGAWSDNGARGHSWSMVYCDQWEFERSIVAPVDTQGVFGWSVGVSESRAIIGAALEDHGDLRTSGAAYVYDLNVDCNTNSIPDGCELGLPEVDCDGDFVLDECSPLLDCNFNGYRDVCDIKNLLDSDCNFNLIPDECDIANGAGDQNADGIPDECLELYCEHPGSGTVFSLKGTAINGGGIPPADRVSIRPGDILDTEAYISCWNDYGVVRTFEMTLDLEAAAVSGTTGTISPATWGASIHTDLCPCDDPAYPVCSGEHGICVGPEHAPEESLFMDLNRPDFVLFGLNGPAAVRLREMDNIGFAATAFDQVGMPDDGAARYAATMRLRASADACGVFDVSFKKNAWNYVCGVDPTQVCEFATLQPFIIAVCEDDGLYCNGHESCDPELGCQIVPQPSCNDDIACTVDSCNEATDGCTHSLNHVACDDGDECTSDECTPVGCIHIDDQCNAIPTTSHWGMAVLALCLLIASKLRFRSRTA